MVLTELGENHSLKNAASYEFIIHAFNACQSAHKKDTLDDYPP